MVIDRLSTMVNYLVDGTNGTNGANNYQTTTNGISQSTNRSQDGS